MSRCSVSKTRGGVSPWGGAASFPQVAERVTFSSSLVVNPAGFYAHTLYTQLTDSGAAPRPPASPEKLFRRCLLAARQSARRGVAGVTRVVTGTRRVAERSPRTTLFSQTKEVLGGDSVYFSSVSHFLFLKKKN